MNSSPEPGEDHDLVFGIGADGLEHLSDRPVVLDAELDRSALGVRFYQNDAVGAARHLVEILEALIDSPRISAVEQS